MNTEYINDKDVVVSVTYKCDEDKIVEINDLISVDVNFRDFDRDINILPLLHPMEKQQIISQLKFK